MTTTCGLSIRSRGTDITLSPNAWMQVYVSHVNFDLTGAVENVIRMLSAVMCGRQTYTFQIRTKTTQFTRSLQKVLHRYCQILQQ
jgi:hypothetical protein